MAAALLLVDLQRDYFPGGRHPLAGADEAVTRAARLLEAARRSDLTTIHVRHLSTRPDAAFFLPDTDGALFHPAVAPAPGESVIEKHFPNAFRETALGAVLEAEGIDRLVVAGMMTHMCIDATVRAASDLGYGVVLAADACATRDLSWQGRVVPSADVQAAFLGALDGRYAEVIGSEKAMVQFEASNSPVQSR